MISVKEEFTDPSNFLAVNVDENSIKEEENSIKAEEPGKNHIIYPMNSTHHNLDQKPLINTVFPPPEFPVDPRAFPVNPEFSPTISGGMIGGVARTDRNEVVFEKEFEGGWVKMVVARYVKIIFFP